MDIAKIEEKLDHTVAGATEISMEFGGIRFQSMTELFEMAKLMSLAHTAVPKHLRGKPGACLAVCVQALEWRMSPFAVANKSYEVNDRIAYESQLIHAVVEARAPLKERLRERYEGEGPERCCIITGHFRGELEPRELRSPTIAKIKVKNSPLWTADPDQQLFYYTTRVWARRHCPDVILGIYSEEELAEAGIGAENAKDVTPKDAPTGIKERLKGGKGRGFSGEHVEAQTAALAAPSEKPIALEPIAEAETIEIVASNPGSGSAPKEPAASPDTPAGSASGGKP